MRSLTFAYRDDDPTSVICAIRAMAARYDDLEMCVVKIKDGGDYEAALFKGAAQAIANTYEIATIDYPAATRLNRLTLWDLHWVKGLEDAGLSTIWRSAQKDSGRLPSSLANSYK